MSDKPKKSSNAEFEVNGKKVTKKEVLDYINREDVVVTNVKIESNNGEKDTKSPLTHEGFEIPQAMVSHMSKTMTRTKSGTAKLCFRGSSKIMNRNFYVVMAEQSQGICRILDDEEIDIDELVKLYEELRDKKSNKGTNS